MLRLGGYLFFLTVLIFRLVEASHARRTAWQLCAALAASPQKAQVTGYVVSQTSAGLRLGHLTWNGQPLLGEMLLPGRSAAPGQGGSYWGKVRCALAAQNPSLEDDLYPLWRLPRFTAVEVGPERALFRPRAKTSLHQALEGGLRALEHRSPSLYGLALAVWTGEASQLPSWLVEQYREAGLLAVLALSGQHVAILVGMARCFLFPLRAVRVWGPALLHLERVLPVLCALLLGYTSTWSASMQRTFVMALSAFALRLRLRHCSSRQRAASSVALAVLWEPALVGSPGFLLSAAAAALVLELVSSEGLKAGLWFQAKLSVAMAVLCLPLSAFFFSKLPWASPLGQLTFGLLWAMVWIPLGFVLPVVSILCPPLLACVEAAWEGFLAVHRWGLWAALRGLTVVRPTLLEVIAMECLALGWGIQAFDRAMRRGLPFRL